jgi:glycosyltransferase involved in cell wall biosynthesis
MDEHRPYKVLLLTRYDRLGASSRVRFLQFLPALAAQGFDFDVRPFFGDEYVRALYSSERISVSSVATSYLRRLASLLQRRNYDLIWLEKEALPWIPGWIESALLGGIPYVVDLDDAWFHRYDQQQSKLVRSMLGEKIDVVMRRASAVVAGNDYLADHARQAGARRIVLIPSAIDLDRYPSGRFLDTEKDSTGRKIIIGWIGTPITAPYLAAIEPAFRTVAAEAPMTLRIVGAQSPDVFAGLATDSVPWSEITEIEQILRLDVGIMPLANTVWERGKCAYKLLQIMAAGRPVIASPVGANCKVVQHGINGFLANSTEEWITALRSLTLNPELRHRFGAAARQTVELSYSTKKVLPSLTAVLKDAVTNSKRPN